jgi:hypothetical protein
MLIQRRGEKKGHWLRIAVRARERQPAAEKLSLIAQTERIVGEELKRDEWRQLTKKYEFTGEEQQQIGKATGFFVLLTNLVKSLVADQWKCFAIAAAGIGLTMLIAFRSPVLAAMALVPNALPIVFVLGVLGWLELKMNMGTAMISAVSMGLSVDSSIHYIMSYQRARRRGLSVRDSLNQVQQTVGRAAVFSTLALVVGFTILCTSQFVPTVYFGALVSLSMLGGLLGNLIVLPLMIQMVFGRRPSRGG